MVVPHQRADSHALLTRPPLPLRGARLACVKPAASVRPEPGSNSQVEREEALKRLDRLDGPLLTRIPRKTRTLSPCGRETAERTSVCAGRHQPAPPTLPFLNRRCKERLPTCAGGTLHIRLARAGVKPRSSFRHCSGESMAPASPRPWPRPLIFEESDSGPSLCALTTKSNALWLTRVDARIDGSGGGDWGEV